MNSQLDRIEEQIRELTRKLDAIMIRLLADGAAPSTQGNNVTQFPARKSASSGLSGDDLQTYRTMAKLTVKQHATLQMILDGLSNQQIADRFYVSINTAKQTVRAVCKKFGVTTRTQVTDKVTPVFEIINPDDYTRIAKGLPKGWHETYTHSDPREDPYFELYTGSRVNVPDDDASD